MHYESKTKPKACPVCGSKKIAKILYGMPVYSDDLREKMDAGKIVLGGCCLSGDDPEWQCVDCETEIFLGRNGAEEGFRGYKGSKGFIGN